MSLLQRALNSLLAVSDHGWEYHYVGLRCVRAINGEMISGHVMVRHCRGEKQYRMATDDETWEQQEIEAL